MKGIVITAGNQITVKEFGEPLYKSVGEEVGGYIEHVRPRGLKEPFCMVVNEDGLNLELPLNPVGSYLYETHVHGEPIVGTIVIMKDGYHDGEPDIVGLNQSEEAEVLSALASIVSIFSERRKV